MKKEFMLMLMVCFTVNLFSQDFKLIEPTIESPVINAKEVKAFAAMNNYRNWGIKKLELDEIMKGKSGEGIKVCVCDTGMSTHKDLDGRVKDAESFIIGLNGEINKDVVDYNGHSTHVSGTVNEIAPNVEFYFAKVLDKNGNGYIKGVANGIKWCIEKDVDIINMSLGAPSPSQEIKKLIDEAREEDILVIAAAGNNGQSETQNTMGYPARYENVIAVGSINKELNVSMFSSSGEEGDVVAPGELILSNWLNDDYIILSGTSMATPYVAAMAALRLEGEKDSLLIEDLYERTATDIREEGFDKISFWGYVNNDFYIENDTTIISPPNDGDGSVGIKWSWQLIVFSLIIVGVVGGLFLYHKKKY